MSDLVDRLRDERHCNHTYLRNEAADEIERLTAELQREHADHKQATEDAAVLLRDAERYNKLKHLAMKDGGLEASIAINSLDHCTSPDRFDAAIDAALKEKRDE